MYWALIMKNSNLLTRICNFSLKKFNRSEVCAMEAKGECIQQHCCTGKRKKESSKHKRNNQSVDEVLKSLEEIPGAQRLRTLATKYTDLDEIHKKCMASITSLEKQCSVLRKECDHLKNENVKQLIARSHLEGLCRELHRLNRMVKDDSVKRLSEEEERRKEITSKFEGTLNEVADMVQENVLKNDQLHGENLSMITKMRVLYKEFESRKGEQLKLDKQLELERRLTQVQIEKSKLEMQAERALWDEERTALTEKWMKSDSNCIELQLLIEQLRKRMETYEEKHHGYKSAIDNNSKFFENCRTEIRSMNSKVALLEKEISMWRERSQQNALKAADISVLKQAQEEQLATALKRVDSLQSLCRQLQSDRSLYLKVLQAKGIDPDCPTYLVKEEIQLSQKLFLLEPIWNQLHLIRRECVTKKEQMSLNALQTFIEHSRTRDAVNSAINLSLGFINFMATNKNANYANPNNYLPHCVAEIT